MLAPNVFWHAVRRLNFVPTADMFASREHHRVPRYYSKDHRDCLAIGNAFNTNWQREQRPYINPPSTDLLRVLQKIQKDQVRALVVAPEWRQNPTWYPLWEKLVENSFVFYDPPYHDESGSFRPHPGWNTMFAILNGRASRLK